MLKKKKGIIIVLIFVISLFIGCISDDGDGVDEDDWGEEGELKISLTIDKRSIMIDESLNLTSIIENIGTTKIRITYIRYYFEIYNSTDTLVEYLGAPPLPLKPSNDDLKILGPGENSTSTRIVSEKNWVLERNESYRAIVHLVCGEPVNLFEDITLPYWKGEIWSNEVMFNVK